MAEIFSDPIVILAIIIAVFLLALLVYLMIKNFRLSARIAVRRSGPRSSSTAPVGRSTAELLQTKTKGGTDSSLQVKEVLQSHETSTYSPELVQRSTVHLPRDTSSNLNTNINSRPDSYYPASPIPNNQQPMNYRPTPPQSQIRSPLYQSSGNLQGAGRNNYVNQQPVSYPPLAQPPPIAHSSSSGNILPRSGSGKVLPPSGNPGMVSPPGSIQYRAPVPAAINQSSQATVPLFDPSQVRPARPVIASQIQIVPAQQQAMNSIMPNLGGQAPVTSPASSGIATKSVDSPKTTEMEAGKTSKTTESMFGTTTFSPAMMNQPQPLALPGAILTDFNKDIKLLEVLMKGGSATLYLAEILSPNLKTRGDGDFKCVVKILKEDKMEEEDVIATFNHEVAILWMFHLSRYIIKILGYSDNPRGIIMKNYPMGSLHDLVHQTSKTRIRIPDSEWIPMVAMKFVRDIAHGIWELHEQDITHNDIKTANVLVDLEPDEKTLRCLLCDFGIAFPVNPEFYGVKMFKRSAVIGASAPYAAPEVFIKLNDQSGEISEYDHPEIVKAGDVYAMGVVMYEVMTRRIPWTELKVDYDKIEKAAMNGSRPHLPEEVVRRWSADRYGQEHIKLMKSCWTQKPLERPTAQQVATLMDKLLKSN